MTLTFEFDLYSAKLTLKAKYVTQRSFISKVTVQTHRQTHKHTNTHPTDCCTWTTKVVGNNKLTDLEDSLRRMAQCWNDSPGGCGWIFLAISRHSSHKTELMLSAYNHVPAVYVKLLTATKQCSCWSAASDDTVNISCSAFTFHIKSFNGHDLIRVYACQKMCGITVWLSWFHVNFGFTFERRHPRN